MVVTTFGNPRPFIQFRREQGEPIVAGAIEIRNTYVALHLHFD